MDLAPETIYSLSGLFIELAWSSTEYKRIKFDNVKELGQFLALMKIIGDLLLGTTEVIPLLKKELFILDGG